MANEIYSIDVPEIEDDWERFCWYLKDILKEDVQTPEEAVGYFLAMAEWAAELTGKMKPAHLCDVSKMS